jgi:hypothetical protein
MSNPGSARERLATPRAGAALAPCMRPAGRSPSDWARFGAYVTEMGTNVNSAVTFFSRPASMRPQIPLML